MNIIEAIKSGRPFKQPLDKVWWNPLVPSEFYNLTREEILSDTWEIQERTVEITEGKFWKAYFKVIEYPGSCAITTVKLLEEMAKELGLKEEPK